MSDNLSQEVSGSAQNTTSHITQSFRDQKQIESFIRANKLQKIIEGAAEQYVRTFQQFKRPEDALAAIVVVIPFEYNDLIYPNASDLLHLAIEEPLQFAEATKYCVFSIVRDFVKSFPAAGLSSIDIAQVHIQVRFSGLPLDDSLIFEPAQNQYLTGLSIVVGILSAFTETQKHVLQTVWFCSAGCSRNKIKSDCVDAPVCANCSLQMCEYSKLRSTQNYRLLRVLPVASVQTPRVINKIFRAIAVRATEHVYDCELTLGTRYLITGYNNFHLDPNEFQAWNLIKH